MLSKGRSCDSESVGKSYNNAHCSKSESWQCSHVRIMTVGHLDSISRLES